MYAAACDICIGSRAVAKRVQPTQPVAGDADATGALVQGRAAGGWPNMECRLNGIVTWRN